MNDIIRNGIKRPINFAVMVEKYLYCLGVEGNYKHDNKKIDF